MAELDFIHQLTSGRVVFGIGALDRVGQEVARLGATRVLLIGGRHDTETIDDVADQLGSRVVGRVDEVVQHVPADVAGSAAAIAGSTDADLALSIGGGAATGLAKAVALKRDLPILAVPTTYAGSEMSPIWGLSDGGRKTTGRDPRVLPRVVVYDPALTVGMPASLTATSGLNAIAHAVEALYAPDGSPVLRLLALEAVRTLAMALPAAVRDGTDLNARARALYGAWLGGLALGNATMGLHHRLAHVLGGGWNLPHGPTHAALLPHVVSINASYRADGLADLAGALGARDAAVGLWDLVVALGAPTALRSLGFPVEGVADAVAAVLATPPANPAPVTGETVHTVLSNALAGARPEPRELR